MRLRKWQEQAVDLITGRLGKGLDRAMIAACPGAGKTAMTVSVVRDETFLTACDVTVVVVPSRALKRQWKKAFRAHGIGAKDDIDNSALESRAAYDEELMFDPEKPVQIFTYSQVTSNPDIFRVLCKRHQVLVVFDEVHHADDDAKFGKALIHAFEGAVFKLSLSGTPFNTKGGRLAFCDIVKTTDDDGRDLNRTVVDFEYAYGEALKATGEDDDPYVVRPAQFIKWKSSATVSYASATGEIEERVVSGRIKSEQLSPLVDIRGEAAQKMVLDGLRRLDGMRQTHANAGLLITAMDRDQCELIVEFLQKKGVRDVTSIMYDTPNVSDEIERWAKSNERVLVAIKMISEGVDIKRLRVGVYLSNVLTQMFFTQFVGRFVRYDGSLDAGQFASIYIPEHVTLIRFAEEIEQMVMEAEDALLNSEPSGPITPTQGPTRIGIESDGEFNGLIESRETMQKTRAQRIAEAMEKCGLVGVLTEHKVSQVFEELLKDNPAFKAAEGDEDTPKQTTVSKLNDQMVAAIVREAERRGMSGWDYPSVHNYANAAVQIRRKDSMTPESKLRERLEVLKKLLVRVRRGEGGMGEAA